MSSSYLNKGVPVEDSARNKKRVLIVDPNLSSGLDTHSMLIRAGYDPVISHSKEEAQEILLKDTIEAVISEESLQDGNGKGLYDFVRKISSIPFILVATENSEFLHRVTVEDFSSVLRKPFVQDDLLSILKNCLDMIENDFVASAHEVKDSTAFSAIEIDDFLSGKIVLFDLFLKIADEKFIKIAHGEESPSSSEVERFKRRGVKAFYMRKDDYQKYVGMNVSISTKLNSVSLSAQKKVLFLRHSAKVLQDSVYLQHVDAEAFDYAKSIVDATLTSTVAHDGALMALESLRLNHPTIYSHSLTVALYSVLIANSLEWRSAKTHGLLAAAAMFHDIGMRELPKELLEKKPADMSAEELLLYEGHADKSVEILSKISSIPKEVLPIVSGHHPAGSKTLKTNTYPLIKVLSLADDFCEMMEGQEPSVNLALNSILRLEKNFRQYDPAALAGLHAVFRRFAHKKAS